MKNLIKIFLVSCLAACGGNSHLEKSCEITEVSTGIEIATTLDDARRLLNNGKQIAFGLDWIILEQKDGKIIKRLRPDAEEKLDEAIRDYPDVLLHPGIFIEIVDEVFWNPDRTPSEMTDRNLKEQDFQAALEAIQLVKRKMPNAKVGTLIPPEAWFVDPYSLELFTKFIPHVDWLATDIYFWTVHPNEISSKLKAANDFADKMRSVKPDIKLFMVFQGFAPVDWDQDPSKWTIDQKKAFRNAMIELFHITDKKYDGSVIWYWEGFPELPSFVFGKRFPSDVKQIYLDGLKILCEK